MKGPSIGVREALGLSPLPLRAREAWLALRGEIPLWRTGNEPVPATHNADPFEETRWDQDAAERTIAACRDEAVRRDLAAEPDPARRAMNVLFQRNYYPTRFAERPALYLETHARAPWLDLPFSADEFAGVSFAR